MELPNGTFAAHQQYECNFQTHATMQ